MAERDTIPPSNAYSSRVSKVFPLNIDGISYDVQHPVPTNGDSVDLKDIDFNRGLYITTTSNARVCLFTSKKHFFI